MEIGVEADEHRELDNDRVFVLVSLRGRGLASGAGVVAKGAAMLQVRDGKVTRFVQYWDRERAKRKLGLAPETDS